MKVLPFLLKRKRISSVYFHSKLFSLLKYNFFFLLLEFNSVEYLQHDFLLNQLASGEVFGPDQPIALKLLGSERSLQALEGTVLK